MTMLKNKAAFLTIKAWLLRHPWLPLFVFVLLMFGLFIGARALNVPDEGRYAEIPREMVLTGDYVTPHLNDVKYFEKPPLFYWLEAAAFKVFGEDEWSARLPNAVFSILGCLIVYLAGRKLFNQTSAIFATLILATSPLYFAMGHLNTLDMSLSVWVTLALLSFLLAIQYPPGHKRRLGMWGLALGCAAATLTKGIAYILLPSFIIFAWLLVCREWRQLKNLYLPSSLVLFLAITVPWHVLVQQANPEFFDFYFLEQQFSRYLTMSAGRYQPVWFFLPIIIAGIFPWIFFLPQALKACLAQTTQRREVIFLLLWAGSIFVFFSLSHSKLIPYILPCLPPLALVLGYYGQMQWQTRQFSKSDQLSAAILVIAVIIICIGAPIALYYHRPPELKALLNFFYAMAITLALGACCTALAVYRQKIVAAMRSLLTMNTVFLLIVLLAIPYTNANSIKPIAVYLKPLLTVAPDSEVVSYRAYYQDLPFYLKRHVTLAGSYDELAFGRQHQPEAQQWLITEPLLWQRWHSGTHPMYIVMHRDALPALQAAHPKLKICVVYHTVESVVLSNQKTAPCQP